ncbi:MAG: T9SS C-terminal target domain-containing protein [Saprospirales bacterium]|nr:MAG: T9SS C-terminal target domain-containing protein [Saprospirales bacterium]
MKNTYFSLLFLFIFTLSLHSWQLSAQQVQQTVVAELFSNTRCGICASRVPGFMTQMEQYGDQVLFLSFYTVSPGNCILHQQAKEVNDARVGHYNISGNPTLYLNGERAPNNVWNNAETNINPLINKTTEIEVSSNLSSDGNGFSADIEIIQHESFEPYQETVLQVYVVEKKVIAGNISSYTDHSNVVRKQLTPVMGHVYQSNAGANQLFSYEFEAEDFWDESEIAVVAFLQGADNTIYNASIAENTISSITQTDRRPDYKIYPNPTSDFVNIYSENNKQKTVSIHNLLGSAIHTETFTERRKKISLSELPRGLYLLRVSSPGLPDRTVRLLIER